MNKFGVHKFVNAAHKFGLGKNSVRKSFITIWAEHKGATNADMFEWSFGDGLNYQQGTGYTMLTSGRILKIGLCVKRKPNSEDVIGVKISINNRGRNEYSVIMNKDMVRGIFSFTKPLELKEGDIINFISIFNSSKSMNGGIVTLLIELDI